MVSEVGLTEWPRTVHTRLERLQLPPNAGITGHIPSLGKLPGVGARRAHVACIWAQVQCGSPWGSPGQHQPLELGRDFSQDPVDAHLGFFGVALLAHGADELLAVVPVALQAGLAEAVATRCGDGLHEHLQTDGAAELLLREESAARRTHACEKEEGNGRVKETWCRLDSHKSLGVFLDKQTNPHLEMLSVSHNASKRAVHTFMSRMSY